MTDTLEPLEFAYAGRRVLVSGKQAVCIIPIKDGKLQEPRLYLAERKAIRTVGGVYSGAKFNATQMLGLTDRLPYVRHWGVQADRIDWQARDLEAEATARASKLEADAKKVSDIERIMLPLREQFAQYHRMRDRAGMAALRAAVTAALESPPRPQEQ